MPLSRPHIVLLALLAACDPDSVCDRSQEELRRCVGTETTDTSPSTTEPVYTYDSGDFRPVEYCAEGSVDACVAGCVVDAVEDGDCAAITDRFQNSDYLKCALDCEDAGSTL